MQPSGPTDEAVEASTGILFGGNGTQLAAQILWILAVTGWAVLVTFPVLVLLKRAGILRSDRKPMTYGVGPCLSLFCAVHALCVALRLRASDLVDPSEWYSGCRFLHRLDAPLSCAELCNRGHMHT